jgi:hypothetical protein
MLQDIRRCRHAMRGQIQHLFVNGLHPLSAFIHVHNLYLPVILHAVYHSPVANFETRTRR